MPTPPQCVCSLSDRIAIKDKPGWFRYTFRCHWERGVGSGNYIDTNTYTVMVDCENGEAEALAMAKEECPYEPKPSPEDRKNK